VTRVGVVGYGTIGKRVVDAIRLQPDMSVVGAAKRSPDHAAAVAEQAGVPLFAAGAESAERFATAGIRTEGTTSDLVERADVVVDATPAGTGTTNRELYAARGTPAVFQGGEPERIAETSFVARANYGDALGTDAARVLSCNATGLTRLLAPLDETYGVRTARATLIRRGSDPAQSDRGPIDDIVPDPVGESHHAPDVQSVFPDLDVRTRAVKVPATQMHLHAVRVTLEDTPSEESVRELLEEESRILLVEADAGVDSCGAAMDLARDMGRPRGDLWENCVFAESIEETHGEYSLFQAIHQESDVVPENVDAVRALVGGTEAAESRRMTDRALGVGTTGTSPTESHDSTLAEDAR